MGVARGGNREKHRAGLLTMYRKKTSRHMCRVTHFFRASHLNVCSQASKFCSAIAGRCCFGSYLQMRMQAKRCECMRQQHSCMEPAAYLVRQALLVWFLTWNQSITGIISAILWIAWFLFFSLFLAHLCIIGHR